MPHLHLQKHSEPKGAIEVHNNIVFAIGSIIAYLENVPEDIVIDVLSLIRLRTLPAYQDVPHRCI